MLVGMAASSTGQPHDDDDDDDDLLWTCTSWDDPKHLASLLTLHFHPIFL